MTRDGARERPQRAVLAAQEIVGEIEGAEHIERDGRDADARQRVAVDHHAGHTSDWHTTASFI